MIKQLAESLKDHPEFLTTQHLVDMGLFPSLDACYLARIRNMTPPFIRLKRKILYPKGTLIEWLAGRSK